MTKRALKLFVLRENKGGALVRDDSGQPRYFSDKMIAKQSKTNETQVVSYGPDHRKFKGAH